MKEDASHWGIRAISYSLPFLLAVVITIQLLTAKDFWILSPTVPEVQEWNITSCKVEQHFSVPKVQVILANNASYNMSVCAYQFWVYSAQSPIFTSCFQFYNLGRTFSCLIDDGGQSVVSVLDYNDVERLTLSRMISRPLAVVGMVIQLLGFISWGYVLVFCAAYLLIKQIARASVCGEDSVGGQASGKDELIEKTEPIQEHENSLEIDVGSREWCEELLKSRQQLLNQFETTWLKRSFGSNHRLVWVARPGFSVSIIADCCVLTFSVVLAYGLVEYVGLQLLFRAESHERIMEWLGWFAVLGICLWAWVIECADLSKYCILIDEDDNLRAISFKVIFSIRTRSIAVEHTVLSISYPSSVWLGSSSISFRPLQCGRSNMFKISRLLQFSRLSSTDVYWAENVMRSWESSL